MFPSTQSAEELGDDGVAITLAGQFDLSQAVGLRYWLGTAIPDGKRRVLLDLSGVEWLDSATLSVIIAVGRAVVQRGGAFVLVRPRPELWEIFEVVGLDRVFPAFETREAALRDGLSEG